MPHSSSSAVPDLSPADLEIHVTTRHDGAGLGLDYVLHSPNNRLDFFNSKFSGACLHRPDEWQKRIFNTLEKLHYGLDSHDVELDKKEVPVELATLGEDLYLQLFPEELRRIWWRKVRLALTVFLISDEPWIPWEIVKPHGAPEEPDDDENGFLATCFQLTRWLIAGHTPPVQVEVARLAVVDAGAPPDHSELVKTAEESGFLQDLAGQHQIEVEEMAAPTHSDVVTLLGEKDLGLLHFAGHGEHDEEDVGTSGFCLHDGRMLRPRDLRPAIRGRLLKNRPLVFLNACESGRQGRSLTRLGGWPQGFLEAGCGAFIAPQWSVNDGDAHTFAITFYQALAAGKTFGEAALEARQALPVDSLGRLAYAVYSHPNGRLHLGPRPQPAHEDLPHQPAPPPPKKPKPSHRSGAGVSRSRRGRPSSRRGMSRGGRWGVIALILLLAAAGVGFQLGGPSEILRWLQESPTEKPESDAGEGTEPPPVAPAMTVPPPSLDIHALQKPPYRADAVNFLLQLPSGSSEDPELWRNRFERTAKIQLVSVGLQLSRSTNASWLAVLEFSEPVVKNGICEISARFELYHERQSLGRQKTFREGASQSNDVVFCEAAIQKIAKLVSPRVISAYFDDQPAE